MKKDNIGSVKIADDVIAVIAGASALEVEGVMTSHSVLPKDIGTKAARRSFAKGIRIQQGSGGKVSINIAIVVKFGTKIHEVAAAVQARVKAALETMLGMRVHEINVSIIGVRIEPVKPKQPPKRLLY